MNVTIYYHAPNLALDLVKVLNKQLPQYQATFIIPSKIKKCATVHLDLEKAFDTIDHIILLRNVNTFGINGTTYNLLSSYLNNRKQHFQI